MRKVVFLLLLVFIAALVASAILLRRSRVYRSDPAALRTSSDYNEIIHPTVSAPEVDVARLEKVQLTVTSNQLMATLTNRVPGGPKMRVLGTPPNFRLTRLRSNHPFRLPAGSVSLTQVGVGYGPWSAAALNDYALRVPMRLFDSSLRELSTNEIAEVLPHSYERMVAYRGYFPEVCFILNVSGLSNYVSLGVKLYDGRTHRPLANGYSSRNDPVRPRFEIQTQMWHAGPVEFVWDFAHGQPHHFESKPAVGWQIEFPGGLLRLVGVGRGRANGSSSSSGGNYDTASITIDPATADKESSFLFLIQPGSMSHPIRIQFMDRAGKTIDSGGGMGSSSFVSRSIRAPLADVDKVVVDYFPEKERLFFLLDRIPGLPAENDHLQNLFDVRLPEVWVRDGSEFKDLLGGTLQMSFAPSFPNTLFPPGYFPRVFTNATPKELLAEFSRNCAPPQYVSVRVSSNEIEIGRTPLQRAVARLAEFFQNAKKKLGG